MTITDDITSEDTRFEPEERTSNSNILPPNMENMDASEFIEAMLSSSHIPEDIRSKFWGLYGRTPKITFLNERDIQIHMLMFEYLRLSIIESLPKEEYTTELEIKFIQMATEFELSLRRSLGRELNERELLGATGTYSFRERQPSDLKNPGFLSSLKKMFGGE